MRRHISASLFPLRANQFMRALAVAFVLLITGAVELQARTVTASWDANTDGVTTGYIVYYGTSSGGYSSQIDVGRSTTYQLNLASGTTYFFVVKAYNALGELGPASTEASITLMNAAPVLTNPGTLSTLVNRPVSVQLVASDPDSDPLTYLATGLPAGASLNSSTGLISGTTTLTSGGSYSVTARASDGNLQASQTFTWQVPAPTVSASASSVTPGATITATVGNGPAMAGDWVGLYRSGDPNTSSIDWKYLNGLRTLPTSGATTAALSFTMPTTAGTYQLRFFANNVYTLLATAPVTVAGSTSPATIVPSTTSGAPGATVTATVANGPGNTADWIGLYSVGAADSTYVDYKYLNGLKTVPTSGVTSASVTFTMPTTPGTYQFRFFANNVFTLLATGATITVSGTAPPPPPPPTGASITVSTTSVATGAPVTATIANGPANTGDWVGLYMVGAPDASYVDYRFLNGLKTLPASGLSSATLTFTMPTVPGTYQFRFFANNVFTLLATSATITVGGGGGGAPTVTASATSVARGGTVNAIVANGPANPADWVGLYLVGASDGQYVDYKFLNGTKIVPSTGVSSATISFTVPTTPGTYELRFYANNLYTLLARSVKITVP
jgi:hypothetical protein